MTYIARRAVVSAAVVAALLAFGAVANAQGPNKCLAGKNKCAAKKMGVKLQCHQRAEKNGAAVDPLCLQKATDKFDGGTNGFAKSCFGKLEIKNDLCTGGANNDEHCEVDSECPGGTCTHVCLTNGDLAAIESKVDNFVDDVVAELDPTYPTVIQNDCSAAKKSCVRKKAVALLKCHAKAVHDGTPPLADPACLDKAHAKFGGRCDGGTNADALCHVDSECPGGSCENGCFTKAEDKGGCITLGDSVALEAKVDAFVQDVLCELGYTTTACGPTPTPTPTLTATPTPTPTATCAPGPVFQGALVPTVGRFNYNATLGLPGANAACNTNFPGSHACTYFELQCAQAAGSLVGATDTSAAAVTSFWAIDPAALPLAQCQDDVSSFQRWEYATAHTSSRGQKVGLNNLTGMLGPLQTGLQCNFSGSSNVGCCQ